MTRRRTRLAAVAAVIALGLAACGGGEDAPTDDAPSADASPTSPDGTDGTDGPGAPDARVPVPEGVELTDEGSDLAFGDGATVVHAPSQTRGSVLELTVTGVRQGRIRDFAAYALDDATAASTPYYVDVTVTNVGEGDVGGSPVPLWAVNASDQLVQASGFTAPFRPCASTPLPRAFGGGESVETCLVYLLGGDGELTAVSFRPTQEFAPIVWTGEITPPEREGRGRAGRRAGDG